MSELNNTYPLNRLNDFNIKYVSLISKYKGRWVICHHKEKDCWNCPGGGIEAGESPIQTAKRELFEETGTVQADFHPLYIYEILSDSGLSYGIQYYCEIKELKELPDFEMDKIDFVDQLPYEKMKTPQVHTRLISDIENILKYDIFN